jgi:pimeloyl-ACP methyl ester carboxylesterase
VSSTTLVLLHGFASSADQNWRRPGAVAALEAAGLDVVAPDMLGHGSAPRPHDPAAYADHAMARRVLDDSPPIFDLAGYSLGAGVASRVALLAPARVRRLALCGMGDSYMDPVWTRPVRVAAALRTGEAHDPETRAFLDFVNASGGDRLALAATQDHVPRFTRDELAALAMPVLVLCGVDDAVNGDPAVLAAAIAGSELVRCAGHHLNAPSKPDFAAALVAFFAA